jgi:hypothetical protein
MYILRSRHSVTLQNVLKIVFRSNHPVQCINHTEDTSAFTLKDTSLKGSGFGWIRSRKSKSRI